MNNLYRFATAAVLLFISFSLTSQVVINEYGCGNKSQHADATGAYEDWVELYNPTGSSVNIGGWHLSDQKGQPLKWTIPAGVSIPAGGRRMFYCSSRDGIFSGQYHTNFKITQSSGTEEICLTNTSGVFIDSLSIKKVRRNHSRGRTTDGASTWSVFETPTPNAANSGGKPEYVPMPVFSLQPGFYSGTQTLTITCSQANTSIYYTTNGAIPTNTVSGTNFLYSGPITISTTRPIRARAFDNNNVYAGSFTNTGTFFINEPINSYPVWSVVSNQLTGTGGFFSGSGNETMVSIEYFGSHNGPRMFQMEGDVKRHGNDSWAYSQKGFRFYARDDYGYANKIDYPLFPTTTRTDYDVVIIKAAGSDNFPDGGSNPPSRCTHNRDAYVQTLSEKFDLNVDVRRFKNAITYINGGYYGIYESRERIDVDYTEHYYGNGEKWVDMLEYWGGLQIVAGSDTAWNNLFNFIVNNSMTNAANYSYVNQRLDFMSLIDYFVLNTYTVNSDWLNWNTAWWRGRKPGQEVKWRYKLWDQDNTFNLGQNYTGLPTTGNTADPCDVQSIPGYANTTNPDEGHVRIFNKLMTNPQFEQLYINRYADLINTAFYCPNMLTHWDTMIARLQPEMQRHVTRWGGTVAQWNTAVTYTRNQISGRCNNVVTGLGPCYNVTGPYPVKVNVSPACAGTVKVNTTTPDQYPWTGNYYGGIDVTFKATPATGWQFSHWQLTHTPNPSTTADSIWFDLGSTGDSVVAVFTQVSPTPGQLTVILQGNNPGLVTVNGTPATNGQVVSVPYGSSVAVSATPIAGCTFFKWTLNHTLVYPNDTLETGTFCFRKNDTLYAVFDQCNIVPDSLTIIVQQPGYGTVTINSVPVPSTPVTVPMNAGTLLNIAATPTAGYTFSNWQVFHHTINPNNTSATASFTFNQRDTLIAVFLPPDTFDLTVLVNPVGGGNVSVNGSTPPNYPTVLKIVDGTPVNIVATANGGFTFSNWTLLHHTLAPNNTTASASFTITQNDTLVANFTANPIPPDTFSLTVLVNPLGGGNVTVNGTTPATYPAVLQFTDSTLINIAALANGGYTFSNWTILHHSLNPNNTSANASFYITQNDTLVANFTLNPIPPDTFNLTVLVVPPGAGNVDVNGTIPSSYPTVLQFTDGTLVNVAALGNGGFTFSNWTILHHTLNPSNTAANASFVITQNDTLIANFTVNPIPPDTFNLTVLVNPVGGGNVNVNGVTPGAYPAVLQITDGTLVNIAALANGGFAFSNWTILHHTLNPGNTSVNANFTITQNDTLVANFTVVPVVDTFNIVLQAFPNNGGSITVNGSTYSTYPTTIKVPENTVLNFTANPAIGFAFVNWHVVYQNPLPSDVANPMNFTATADDTVYAFFADMPDTFNLTVVNAPAGGGVVTINGNTLANYPATLQFQEGTAINASVLSNTGFTFTNWSILNHTLAPNNTDASVNFTINTSDTLTANYYVWPDTLKMVVDVRPNSLAGEVKVGGFTPPGYPWELEVQQGMNLDFEATGKVFTSGNGTVYNYVFERYEFIYHNPIPNPTTPVVFVNVQYPDTVIAYFINKPVDTDTTVFVLLPTAFSPDGDGKNDIFHVVGEQLQEGNLQIYNRWGQKVFESNNPNDYGWNGEFNNKPCQMGVYAYILVGKRLNGDEIKMKGAVTLVR